VICFCSGTRVAAGSKNYPGNLLPGTGTRVPAAALITIEHICVIVVGNAIKSKAIFEWFDWKASNGEAKMGNGIQGLPSLCGWIYELAGILTLSLIHCILFRVVVCCCCFLRNSIHRKHHDPDD